MQRRKILEVKFLAILSAESKRFLRRIDLTLLFAAVAIVIYGLVIISSATHINTPGEERFWYVQRQGIFAVVNAAMAVVFMQFDYRGLSQHGFSSYAVRARGIRCATLDSNWTD